MQKISKASLAKVLSHLKGFEGHLLKHEQYETDSQNAAEVIWNAFMAGDVEGKTIADFGCGTGILGIGCLLLGAEKVFFVDLDEKALEIAKSNVSEAGIYDRAEFLHMEIGKCRLKTDTVMQNPPFGTKQEHADKEFLLTAFETAAVVYSIHKATTQKFVEALAADHAFKITMRLPLKLILWNTQKFHQKKLHRIDAACYKLIRI